MKPPEEIRVFVKYDSNHDQVVRNVGKRAAVADDKELMDAIVSMADDYKKAKQHARIIIDAAEDAPFGAVYHIVELCRAKDLDLLIAYVSKG